MTKDFNKDEFHLFRVYTSRLTNAGYPIGLAQLAALRYMQAPAGNLTEECRGFYWGQTPEGYDFWRGVYLDWKVRKLRAAYNSFTPLTDAAQHPKPVALTVQITLEGFAQ